MCVLITFRMQRLYHTCWTSFPGQLIRKKPSQIFLPTVAQWVNVFIKILLFYRCSNDNRTLQGVETCASVCVICSVLVQVCICHLFSTCASVCLSLVEYLCKCVSIICWVLVQVCVCHLFNTCASVWMPLVQYLFKCVSVTCSVNVQACVCHLFSTCASVCLSHVHYVCKCVVVTCSICVKHVSVTCSVLVQVFVCHLFNTYASVCLSPVQYLCKHVYVTRSLTDCYTLNGGFCDVTQSTLTERHALQLEWLFLWQCVEHQNTLCQMGAIPALSPLLTDGTLYKVSPQSFGPFIFSLLSAVCRPSATGCFSSGLAATLISLKSVVIWGVRGYRLHIMCDFTSVFSLSFLFVSTVGWRIFFEFSSNLFSFLKGMWHGGGGGGGGGLQFCCWAEYLLILVKLEHLVWFTSFKQIQMPVLKCFAAMCYQNPEVCNAIATGKPKWRCKLAWIPRQCANISVFQFMDS